MASEFVYQIDNEISIELSSDWLEEDDIWGCYVLIVGGWPTRMSNDFFGLKKHGEGLSVVADLEVFFVLTDWMAAVA